MKALEMGAVEKLIVWENLEYERVVLMNPQSGEETVRIVQKEKLDQLASDTAKDGGPDMEIKESESLVDWLAQNYKRFGAHLDLVTDRTAEGSQFVKGFGGIGGILRYQIDIASLDQEEGDESDLDEEDWAL
jgi:peptide chain release factor subunit 1